MKNERDPIELFTRWQQRANAELAPTYPARIAGQVARRLLRPIVGELPRADAAALATATSAGKPTVRQVLLKETSSEGFVFYTNYSSLKARDLDDNPLAALAFHWPFPPRQVRVEGRVDRLSPEQNEAYWQTRPRGSQLGALVSRQSEVVSGPDELGQLLERARRYWAGRTIPCPSFWGGFRLIPQRFEFWQGRIDRLHDRWQYDRDDNAPNGWRLCWLAP